MTLKISGDSAIAAAQAVLDLIDAGTGDTVLNIYGGVEPADPSVVTAEVVLVSFTLPRPAFDTPFDEPTGAVATAKTVPAEAAAATGTATWFRFINGDGEAKLQGSVSNNAGTGDLKISSTSIISGIEVSVDSLTYTQPK